MITAVAEDTAKAGHSVTVVTSRRGYNLEETYPERGEYRGVQILRVGGAKLNRHSFFGRLANYFSFIFLSALKLFRLPKADGLVITSAPPFSLLPASLLKAFRGTPFVYIIEDLYPEIVFASGMIKPRSVGARLLSGVFGFFMRQARETIVLGGYMKWRVSQAHPRLPEASFHPIDNWQDGELLYPLPRPARADSGFCVQYSGNLGEAHDIETLAAGMALLAGTDGLRFQFVGRGKRRAELEKRVQDLKIPGCLFEDYVPAEKLNESLNQADLCLVSLAIGYEGLIVPSKIYGIMAVGRPVLFIGALKGEIPELIRKHSLGWVVEQGDVAAFVRAVQEARSSPALCARYGENARRAFDQFYSRGIATAKYIQVFERLQTRPLPKK